jgi:hypothetical protein
MPGARVERIDLQFHPVHADLLEGVRQREPARLGAQAAAAELVGAKDSVAGMTPIMPPGPGAMLGTWPSNRCRVEP